MIDELRRWHDEREAPAPGPLDGAGRAATSLLLGGLTAVELLALALVVGALVALLWASGAATPEGLFTDPWQRAAWALLVASVLRPPTWIPYVAVYLPARSLARRLRPGGSVRGPNAAAALLALAAVAGLLGLVFASVEGAARWTLSALAYVAGGGDVHDLGHSLGAWNVPRMAAVVLALLLIRPVVPPLDRDLDVAVRPLLGLVDGRRGSVDRWLLFVAVAVATVMGTAAWLIGRSA